MAYKKTYTKTQIDTERHKNKRHRHRHRQNTETKREKNTDKTKWTRVIDEFTRVTDNKDDRRIHRKACICDNNKKHKLLTTTIINTKNPVTQMAYKTTYTNTKKDTDADTDTDTNTNTDKTQRQKKKKHRQRHNGQER